MIFSSLFLSSYFKIKVKAILCGYVCANLKNKTKRKHKLKLNPIYPTSEKVLCMSKTSPFNDVPCIKSVTFFENYRCSIKGFCSNSLWNLTFCFIFLWQKTAKYWRCNSHKISYIFRKFSLYYMSFCSIPF